MTKKRMAADDIKETPQANWLALLRQWKEEKLLAKLHAGDIDEDLVTGRLLIWIDKMLKKWAVQHLWGTRVEQRLKETKQRLAETEQRLVALEQWRLEQVAGSGKPVAGSRKREAGSGKRAAGSEGTAGRND